MTSFALNPMFVNIPNNNMATSITFRVGSTQQPFTFPLAVIDKNTYLDRYLSFDGKKIMNEDTYVLPDENPRLFNEFHSFLLGGDFNWDEEICQYFGYMGYPNTLGYPLDFWKIKLQDNWIRNNFYRMKLWQPCQEGEEDPLLIERGPYVGLVDLTPSFQSQLIGPPRTTIKDLEVFRNVIDFSTKEIIIAGGALVALLYGDDRLPADIDIFITTKDEDRANELIKGKSVV